MAGSALARSKDMRGVALLTIALILWGASDDPHRDPFGFFWPSVSLAQDERAVLEKGEPLVVVLNTEGRELAVFTAIGLDRHVTADRLIAWMQNVAQFRRSTFVLAVQRFSNPPRIEDLAALTLDDGDLKDLEDCRPGDCGLKLSDAEIQRLRHVMRVSNRRSKAATQAAFRELVLQRVRGYAAQGHSALEAYHDQGQPRSPALAFDAILQRSKFLHARAPDIIAALTRTTGLPSEQVDSFIYWSKERFGGKAVINATHVRILRPTRWQSVEVIMTGTQIFATHYLDACLGVTALVRDPQTSRGYFVYVNRSEVDVLGGFWGRIARRIIKGRMREDGPPILRELAQRLAAGDPPPIGAPVETAPAK